MTQPVPISRARSATAKRPTATDGKAKSTTKAKQSAEPVTLTVVLHFAVDGQPALSAPLTVQIPAPQPGQQGVIEMQLDARKILQALEPHLGPTSSLSSLSAVKPALTRKLWTPGS